MTSVELCPRERDTSSNVMPWFDEKGGRGMADAVGAEGGERVASRVEATAQHEREGGAREGQWPASVARREEEEARTVFRIPQQRRSSPLEIRQQGGPGLGMERHFQGLDALAAGPPAKGRGQGREDGAAVAAADVPGEAPSFAGG